MILSKDETEEIVNAAQTIILCANHQRKLCSDILTLSKLDANLLAISLDKVDPVFLVQKALRMYAPELQAAEIEAILDVDSSLEQLMIGDVVVDPSRLLQGKLERKSSDGSLTNQAQYLSTCSQMPSNLPKIVLEKR